MVPVSVMVGLCVLLTLQAGTVFDYLGRTVASLAQAGTYQARVLGEPPVRRLPAGELMR